MKKIVEKSVDLTKPKIEVKYLVTLTIVIVIMGGVVAVAKMISTKGSQLIRDKVPKKEGSVEAYGGLLGL